MIKGHSQEKSLSTFRGPSPVTILLRAGQGVALIFTSRGRRVETLKLFKGKLEHFLEVLSLDLRHTLIKYSYTHFSHANVPDIWYIRTFFMWVWLVDTFGHFEVLYRVRQEFSGPDESVTFNSCNTPVFVSVLLKLRKFLPSDATVLITQ
jgi:hypothetical protein